MQSYSNYVYTFFKWYMSTCTCTVNQMQAIFLEIGSDNIAYATEAELMKWFGAIVGIKIMAAGGLTRRRFVSQFCRKV